MFLQKPLLITVMEHVAEFIKVRVIRVTPGTAAFVTTDSPQTPCARPPLPSPLTYRACMHL